MKPWIIERIKQEKRKKEEENKIQPRLPLPLPMWGDPPERETPGRGSSIVDFEIKT